VGVIDCRTKAVAPASNLKYVAAKARMAEKFPLNGELLRRAVVYGTQFSFRNYGGPRNAKPQRRFIVLVWRANVAYIHSCDATSGGCVRLTQLALETETPLLLLALLFLAPRRPDLPFLRPRLRVGWCACHRIVGALAPAQESFFWALLLPSQRRPRARLQSSHVGAVSTYS
jgi:hypothetical protein